MCDEDRKEQEFKWNANKERAAQLLAEDELTDEEIAGQCGVHVRRLYIWKNFPAFKQKVDDIRTELGDTARRQAIGMRRRRVRALQDRWQKMQAVIDERAADPGMQAVPGGKTGLLVRTYKAVGKGSNFRLVEEYRVDTGLLKELRDHEKQAAQELGQWVEKTEQQGSYQLGIVEEIVDATPDKVVEPPSGQV